MSNARTMVEELVYRSCMLLDEKDFKGYLDLCDPEFRYTITAYSPEIKREMIWLEHDKTGIQTLFNNLPRHNSDHSPLTRHVTVYTVTVDDAKKEAQVVSGLQVFKTALDGGITELFGVGKLYDTVRLNGDSARLLRRNVRLDTRMLGIGYHIPF
ncbi:MAG: aromatic-ring-hydroxylating dioxygenase subunit beta [Pseudomonadota bacterium]